MGQGRWSLHPEMGMAPQVGRGVPRLPRVPVLMGAASKRWGALCPLGLS